MRHLYSGVLGEHGEDGGEPNALYEPGKGIVGLAGDLEVVLSGVRDEELREEYPVPRPPRPLPRRAPSGDRELDRVYDPAVLGALDGDEASPASSGKVSVQLEVVSRLPEAEVQVEPRGRAEVLSVWRGHDDVHGRPPLRFSSWTLNPNDPSHETLLTPGGIGWKQYDPPSCPLPLTPQSKTSRL